MAMLVSPTFPIDAGLFLSLGVLFMVGGFLLIFLDRDGWDEYDLRWYHRLLGFMFVLASLVCAYFGVNRLVLV